MCKYHYFYSLDELNQFASANGITIDESDLQPFRMQPDEWLAGLALDGVTELCKVWRASVYSEQRTHIQCFRGVRVVGTGTVLIPTTPPNHSWFMAFHIVRHRTPRADGDEHSSDDGETERNRKDESQGT